MKSFILKVTGPLLLLLVTSLMSAADPGMLQLLNAGQLNTLISALSNSNDPESLNLLSRAYFSMEDWDNAVRTSERAISLRPEDASYHLWMGRAYGEKAAEANPLKAAGLARKAKAEFERAVKLNPNDIAARADLAEYYVEAPAIMGGGLDKAREQAAEIEKLDPATAHWVLSRVARKEKRLGDEERELRAGLAVAKNPAEYWLHLASYYRQQGQPAEMEKLVQTAVAQPDKPSSTYYDAAEVLFEGRRDFPMALQYLKKYLASDQMVEDAPAFRAHYLQGRIYEAMGNRGSAAAEYQQALAMASDFGPARAALERVQ